MSTIKNPNALRTWKRGYMDQSEAEIAAVLGLTVEEFRAEQAAKEAEMACAMQMPDEATQAWLEGRGPKPQK